MKWFQLALFCFLICLVLTVVDAMTGLISVETGIGLPNPKEPAA